LSKLCICGILAQDQNFIPYLRSWVSSFVYSCPLLIQLLLTAGLGWAVLQSCLQLEVDDKAVLITGKADTVIVSKFCH
jgi:hypothetical protein